MATVTTQATPTSNTTPAVVKVEKELSGPQWVNRFPGINALDELAGPFKTAVSKFFDAMKAGGITLDTSRIAIYRPPQRSYLMHYSKRITTSWPGNPQLEPADVPEFSPQGQDSPVNIDWVHKDANGNPDTDASKKAAQQMVNSYGIGSNPVAAPYSSRHNTRPSNAIDLPSNAVTISRDCKVKDANGKDVAVTTYTDLHAVGESYGVYKLLTDPPHWSNDGH